jgi:DNA-binding beta-propeller fold protein YncE
MQRRSLVLGGTLLTLLTCLSAAATIAVAQSAGRARSGAAKPEAARASSTTVQAPVFEVDPMWPKPMPNHWILGSAVGLAVDAHDNVFVLNLTDSFNARTESGSGTTPPTGECCTPSPNILEYDPSGELVGHWGGPASGYVWPTANTGLGIDGAGNVWVGGAGAIDTRILKFAPNGRFFAEFGNAATMARGAGGTILEADTAYGGMSPARPAAGARGGRGGRAATPALPANSTSLSMFGGADGFSFDPQHNEVYVADGSRNHRVVVLDGSAGAVKRMWGAYGNKPVDADVKPYVPGGTPSKQFGSPVMCAKYSADSLVYVCDTQNDRIQVFKRDGSFVKEKLVAPQTLGTGSVWDVAFSPDPEQKYLYVADGMNMKVHVLDRQSLDELTSFGDGGRQPGEFYAIHSIATDSKGNIYTAETYEGKRVQKFIFKGVQSVTKPDQGVVWPAASGKKP